MSERAVGAPATTSGGGAALRELARAIAGMSCESAGERVVETARRRVFDTLGAACLGFATPEGRALRALDAELAWDTRARDAVLAGDGRPRGAELADSRARDAELAADGRARGALERCALLAAAARTTEIDDIDVASCTTVGCVVVPAALALAASRTLSDRDLLAGVVCGYEAMTRLGRAIGGALLLYRGVWPTYATAAFGSAAAAAKLLGLDAERTAHALAMAVARSGALPAGSSARFAFRYYALGAAVADGCAAACAAAAGVEAEPDDVAAFAARIGAQLDEAELARGLGREWRICEVETKMLPSSRQALAAVEAFMALRADADRVDDVERIVVSVPPPYRAMVDRPQPPARRLDSLLSVQYQIALAALEPDALYDALREPVRGGAAIAALMGRIEVRAHDGLGAQFPRHWGSEVLVRRRSGEETSVRWLDPPDARDTTWEALQRKLERIFAASGLDGARTLDALLAESRSLGEGSGAGGAARLLAGVESFLGAAASAGPAGKAAGAP